MGQTWLPCLFPFLSHWIHTRAFTAYSTPLVHIYIFALNTNANNPLAPTAGQGGGPRDQEEEKS